MQTFQQEQMEKQMQERSAELEANKTEGAKYLEENAKKEGVVTTESGLQYSVVTAVEEGTSPTLDDTVVVHYRGTLINGEEFDSSYSRNQPATFGVGAVIPGWTEVLQLMKPGEKFNVVIPSELAYGEGGAGAKIGPNATLLFEVELLEILPKEAAE
jgi:FKBP-type peptidyl-prolyl cis-trans isomerase